MTLTIINHSQKRIPQSFLEKKICNLWRTRTFRSALKSPTANELSLVFVTNPQMKKLNHKYRKKAKTTDVLSFQSSEPSYLGDIVICVPVAYQQSKTIGISVRAELLRLVVHGLTHLLGYDHEISAAQAKEFFGCEERLLALVDAHQ